MMGEFNPWMTCSYCGGPLGKYGCPCEPPEPTDDDLQAQADAEQDSRELENEISRGGWPK